MSGTSGIICPSVSDLSNCYVLTMNLITLVPSFVTWDWEDWRAKLHHRDCYIPGTKMYLNRCIDFRRARCGGSSDLRLPRSEMSGRVRFRRLAATNLALVNPASSSNAAMERFSPCDCHSIAYNWSARSLLLALLRFVAEQWSTSSAKEFTRTADALIATATRRVLMRASQST